MTKSAQLLLLALTIFTQSHLVCHAITDDNEGAASPIPTFTLANGITVPLIGLGSASGVAYPHIQSAIEAGYRYVDTAQSHSWGYREEDVGKAVHDAERRYEDGNGNADEYVYTQTKIHPQDLGYHSTQKAIRLSLERLQVTSLDSVLLHKPRCWESICSREPEGTWQDSWVALEEAVDSKVVRSIGICDVDDELLDELLQQRIGPMVIQNWFDPFHQDTHFRLRIKQHNREHPERKILYQGYSTLGSQWFHIKGYDENIVLTNPSLRSIAKGHGATVPQVVIQWATRMGVMVLPASTNPIHQASNLDSFHFELNDEEMRAIDDLDGHPPPLRERNAEQIQVQFINRADGPMNVYWVPDGRGQDESSHVLVGEMDGSGDVFKINSYHGHEFVFKEGGGGSSKVLNRMVVNRTNGATQNHAIEDNSEEL